MDIKKLNQRVSSARSDVEARQLAELKVDGQRLLEATEAVKRGVWQAGAGGKHQGRNDHKADPARGCAEKAAKHRSILPPPQ